MEALKFHTGKIIDKINADFVKEYPMAAGFVNSGKIWDFCIETIQSPSRMTAIVFANDLGIPPVKSLLVMLGRTEENVQNITDDDIKKSIGSLMAFVFKFTLGYNGQVSRTPINTLGVKTATRYYKDEKPVEWAIIEFVE